MARVTNPLSPRWAELLERTPLAARVAVGSGDATLLATVAVVLALMISAGSSNPGALLLLAIASALLLATRSVVAAKPSKVTYVGCGDRLLRARILLQH